MKYLAKNPIVVIVIFTLLFYFVLSVIFNIEHTALNGGIAAGIAVLLSPRKKRIQTQAGEKIQITWIFLKKALILD